MGMMGVGKTTVGKLVADRLGWEHVDSDALVEAATGRSIPELFADGGEPIFRAEESRVLAEVLGAASSDGNGSMAREGVGSSGMVGLVVSVGGGAVLSDANRDVLGKSGEVVWLRADPSTLLARVGEGEGRPLLGDDPETALMSLCEERRSLYESVANRVIDVDALTTEEVVERVVDGRSRR